MERVISAAADISHAICPDSTLIVMKEQDVFWFLQGRLVEEGQGRDLRDVSC